MPTSSGAPHMFCVRAARASVLAYARASAARVADTSRAAVLACGLDFSGARVTSSVSLWFQAVRPETYSPISRSTSLLSWCPA
jgi:hypothetical protein